MIAVEDRETSHALEEGGLGQVLRAIFEFVDACFPTEVETERPDPLLPPDRSSPSTTVYGKFGSGWTPPPPLTLSEDNPFIFARGPA
jgi:hypothetical protein